MENVCQNKLCYLFIWNPILLGNQVLDGEKLEWYKTLGGSVNMNWMKLIANKYLWHIDKPLVLT